MICVESQFEEHEGCYWTRCSRTLYCNDDYDFLIRIVPCEDHELSRQLLCCPQTTPSPTTPRPTPPTPPTPSPTPRIIPPTRPHICKP